MTGISFAAFVFATNPYCNLQFVINRIVNNSTFLSSGMSKCT